MPHVPNQLVIGGIENIMKCYRELNYPETGAKMATVDGNIVDDKMPQFITKLNELSLVKFLDILRTVNF